ncbi:MAG: aspartate-semialdehyde dehydrogenase [Synergistales bacterium]|nr:aspartate-semialdehyde dehydrogenase [Synergistales bacterium]
MRVAVLGATGLVGGEMCSILEERSFPVDSLVPLASERSAGRSVSFAGERVEVCPVSAEAFDGVDIALFSAGAGVSREWAPVAAEAGAVVIDNSSAWRMEPDVPLVVPEVNPEAALGHRGIIANPNCATIQTVAALHPIHRARELLSFHAVTFQSVSGSGNAAVEELDRGSEAALRDGAFAPSVYPEPIAFNVLPQIGSFDEYGISGEEWKMVRESRKILDAPWLQVSCTAVRVPVRRGHAVSVTVRCAEEVTPGEVAELLEDAPGVEVCGPDRGEGCLTPLAAAGTDPVYVGRIRWDTGMLGGVALWVVADNLRKGAALNAVQIAELLVSPEGRQE